MNITVLLTTTQYDLTLIFMLVQIWLKNKGFLSSGPAEIPIQRNQMIFFFKSLLPACKEPDIDSGVRFKADAITANTTTLGILSCYLHFF